MGTTELVKVGMFPFAGLRLARGRPAFFTAFFRVFSFQCMYVLPIPVDKPVHWY